MADPRPFARLCSLSEAVSYLVLLGIAMPLKYVWRLPMAVHVFGMIHGVLFLLLIWFLLRSHFEKGWPASRVWLLVGAALVPIVPFFLDRRVRRWLEEQEPT
ncbi:MAG TPA: DUF3817 domain-containing protein [Planctomycetota bacterium]|nr:DUF3817 domain-containing protein [Planctomycetota bacterium]